MLLRARVVLPITSPPLEDGAVLLSGNRIVHVGRWKELQSAQPNQVVDLGESVLLPGLINAHCHLDYTGMAGQITPPRSFSDWIKAILALKAHATYSDYASAWIEGARMLLRNGTTTVADVEAVPELLPEVRTTTPLRVCSLLELTGVRRRRSPQDILDEAVRRIHQLPAPHDWAGLSPHATYSTNPELLQLSATRARAEGWILACHIAESEEEFQMFREGSGLMYEWLQPQRDMSDCGLGSPVQHAHRYGLLHDNLLAIHVNYLAPGDAALLATSGASVVHCPRSHEYFRHRSFPRQELEAAGVNICLGTDSLASVHAGPMKAELSLLAELRVWATRDPSIPPARLLAMATIDGAHALGRGSSLGQIQAGALADLIAIPSEASVADAAEAVLCHTAEVPWVMIDGRWCAVPK